MQRPLIVSRRGFLVATAGVASAMRAMPSTPACVLTSEQEEGPYYVDYDKVRQAITEDKQGVPLYLRIALVHAKLCTPLTNAALDIWHCDAQGVYSAFTANSLGGPGGPHGPGDHSPGPLPEGFGPPTGGGFDGPPPGHPRVTDSTRFLRGIQSTNATGIAEFTTIYPGWYMGRAIHIHLKVHAGGHVAHTGQLFFPEEVTETIAKLQPYAKHQDVYRTKQSEDDIFESQHGASGLVTLKRIEAKSDAAGFIATVTLAVDPDATPEPVGRRGPGPGFLHN